METTSKKALTLPNLLTVLRMTLVPLVIWVYFCVSPYVALGVYILACGTDVLDGYLARKLNQVSTFGKWADPLADKLMTQAVVICLALDQPLLWIVAGVLFVKEGLMGIGAVVVYYKDQQHMVFAAKWIGKLATCLMFSGLVLCFFEKLYPWNIMCLGIGLGCSVTAFFYYVIRSSREMAAHKKGKTD